MIIKFENCYPKLGQNVYISENASVIGDVILGDEVNIWFGSVVRGDMNYIKIGAEPINNQTIEQASNLFTVMVFKK